VLWARTLPWVHSLHCLPAVVISYLQWLEEEVLYSNTIFMCDSCKILLMLNTYKFSVQHQVFIWLLCEVWEKIQKEVTHGSSSAHKDYSESC
jgi:hypothetical protein